MPIDILIFAIIAAVLVHKLRSVLGTRTGAEKDRPNPFAPTAAAEAAKPVVVALRPRAAAPAFSPETSAGYVTEDSPARDDVLKGLGDIAAADAGFEIKSFMDGAHYAFDMIVTAYHKGDEATLKPLVSPKLFLDFSAGIADAKKPGAPASPAIPRVRGSKIVEARLLGVMAYVTVDFDVDGTAQVHDVWMFARDIRASDPNWILIETRSEEK